MRSISSDKIAEKDLLGRDRFAQQIVNSLMQAFKLQEESLVIGIAGKWGTGKSTLLAFIERHLHEAYNQNLEKYRVIRFNPWATTSIDIDDIQRSLLEAVIKELEQIKWKHQIKEADNKIKHYLKHLQYLKFLKHVHPVTEKIGNALEEYLKNSSIDTLDEVKKQADQLLKEKGIQLYIMLDDLDRLTPEEITAIFKAIKMNLNFVHTHFIVAYDKQVVIESLKKKFGNNAESYLEKIIQVDFTMPEILEEQISAIFFSRLLHLFDSLELKLDTHPIKSLWKYHGLQEYFRTIRDLNRYFNSLVFSLPNIGNEINIADFLTLEAIKVFDYPAYEKLYLDFVSKRREAVWGSSSFDAKAVQEYAHITTKALLQFLIPQDQYDRMRNSSLQDKRLHDPEFFPRYYSLYIPSHDITEETLNRFLLVSKNRKLVLSEVVQHGKAINFLRRLAEPELKKFFKIDDPYIFDSFLQFWNDNEQYINAENDVYLWNAYFNIAHSFLDAYQGAKAASEALILHENSGQPIKFLFNHFILASYDEGRQDSMLNGDVAEQAQLLLPFLTEKFKDYLRNNISTYFHKGTRGYNTFLAGLFVYSLAKYCPEVYYKEMNRYIEDYAFAGFLLKSHFVMISSGDTKPWRLRLQHKEILLPGTHWKTFLDTLQNAPKGTWSDEDQVLVEYFLTAINPETAENS